MKRFKDLRIGPCNVLSFYRSKSLMGRWCDGRCQEVGGEKLEECCKEEGQLAEASEEGLGSKGAVVPMMMMMNCCKHTAVPPDEQ